MSKEMERLLVLADLAEWPNEGRDIEGLHHEVEALIVLIAERAEAGTEKAYMRIRSACGDWWYA